MTTNTTTTTAAAAFRRRFAITAACLGALAGFGLAPGASAAPITKADVIVLVDESVSISAGEIAWLGSMITSLEADLITAGVTSNRYGLVGFVETNYAHGSGASPHKHLVGGGDFGTAAQFNTATGTLNPNGSALEDGFGAIDFALDNYSFRSDAAVNFILLTDEDRDDTTGGTVTSASLLNRLNQIGAKVNVIVNNGFSTSNGTALGLSGTGAGEFGYRADGSGGFIKDDCGVVTCTVGNGAGNTENDYVPFAFASDGAAWNLNIIDNGGSTVDSFTKAFVDLKVEEITTSTPSGVPEPATTALLAIGLLGAGLYTRRRSRRA